MKISNALKEYIQNNIFKWYNKNDQGHNLEHIKYVINRSIKFADTIPDIDYNIVYTVAAYHDLGHHINPKIHELVSAEMMYNDNRLKTKLITVKEGSTMALRFWGDGSDASKALVEAIRVRSTDNFN